MSDVVRASRHRSVWLVSGFLVVFAAVGAVIGVLFGSAIIGAAVGLVVAAGFVLWSYLRADAIALAVSRAEPADETEHARLHNMIDGLCLTSGIPKPDVYVVDDVAPNALVVGRDAKRASIAVTTGMLALLDRVELEGIVAQRLSSIRGSDTRVASLTVTMLGGVAMLGDLVVRKGCWNGGREPRNGDPAQQSDTTSALGRGLLAVSPLTGRLVRAVVPRQRLTLSDIEACQLTRYPPGLISALEKLDQDCTVTHAATSGTAHLWIAQPMSGVGDAGRLGTPHRHFDTHPPLDERIALLREL
jgi:heat shock protein HtpX